MVGGEIKVGEKVCPYYAIFHVSDGEIELEVSLSYGDGAGDVTIASDLCAVGGPELRSGRSQTALLASGRNDGE